MKFYDHSVVELVDVSASDESVARAAWVSTVGEESRTKDPEKMAGLINYLVRERHGCYDDDTDVLTEGGWVNWRNVTGSEKFATLNLKTDEIEFQSASARIRKKANRMISVKKQGVDLLVTEDHNMVASARTHEGFVRYELTKARELHNRSYKMLSGGGNYSGGVDFDKNLAALAGFILADGNYNSGSINFRLRKKRKIDFLKSLHSVVDRPDDHYSLKNVSQEVKELAKDSYDKDKNRKVPDAVFGWSAASIEAFIDGFLKGDGNKVDEGRSPSFSSVSPTVLDGIQHLALLSGRYATARAPDLKREGAFGTKPLFKMAIREDFEKRIGWTTLDREEQVKTVDYDGEVHCVTVPNGTLYVRRNGKTAWSGNSPTEHNMFKFFVKTPLFIRSEFHRHRVGWSYNEASGRYSQLEPEFYLINAERKLKQTGKTGEYIFEPGTLEQFYATESVQMETSIKAYEDYERLLEMGVAKEVARMHLPLNLMTTFYATCNARSLMNFLALRTSRDNATFKSSPQWEIDDVATQMEAYFKEHMPITYAAFEKNGRVAP